MNGRFRPFFLRFFETRSFQTVIGRSEGTTLAPKEARLPGARPEALSRRGQALRACRAKSPCALWERVSVGSRPTVVLCRLTRKRPGCSELSAGFRPVLRKDFHVGEHRHEVRVARPARHDVEGDGAAAPGPGGAAEVPAGVEALRGERLRERGHALPGEPM